MFEFLSGAAVDPMTTLHALLSFNYGAAAMAARDEGHARLMRCYLGSALIYALMGVAHLLHVG